MEVAEEGVNPGSGRRTGHLCRIGRSGPALEEKKSEAPRYGPSFAIVARAVSVAGVGKIEGAFVMFSCG
jgi:hypothetical protein